MQCEFSRVFLSFFNDRPLFSQSISWALSLVNSGPPKPQALVIPQPHASVTCYCPLWDSLNTRASFSQCVWVMGGGAAGLGWG